MFYSAVNDLILPTVRQAVQRTQCETAPTDDDLPEDWAMEPAKDDAALTPPVQAEEGSMVSRLTELSPKLYLLCAVHSAVIMSTSLDLTALLVRHGWMASLLGVLCLGFSAWSTLYLTSGVIENVIRRWTWHRLLENGILLQPEQVGFLDLLTSRQSAEFRALCIGMLCIAAAAYVALEEGRAGAVLCAAAGILILHKAWITDWRLPSACALVCGPVGGPTGVDTKFIAMLVAVPEHVVAMACASLPTGTTSFSALTAHIRCSLPQDSTTSLAPTTDTSTGSRPATAAVNASIAPPPRSTQNEVSTLPTGNSHWVHRNWAMRFLGVPPPITIVAPLLGASLPVRPASQLKTERDRCFARRMCAWQLAFQTVALAVQCGLAHSLEFGALATATIVLGFSTLAIPTIHALAH